MHFIDYVVIAVVVLILGAAVYAIYRSRKNGNKCIGCPNSGKCSADSDNNQCLCDK